jgi:glyoxylase-like metal-dependent hydrolase (beta-lactamase superfamily II)
LALSVLVGSEFDASGLATLLIPAIDGYDMSGPMITALPYAGYDLANFKVMAAPHVRSITKGEVIDLGNRVFEFLHSPGGLGLWEAATKTLFSGDAIYDGPLIDNLHHSNIRNYKKRCVVLSISSR